MRRFAPLDGLEHRREDLIAVGQDVVVVPVGEVAADQRRDVRRVAGFLGAGGAPDLQRDLILREHHAAS